MRPTYLLLSMAFFSLISLLSSEAVALDNAPPFSISPTLNGLNITYFTHQDKFKLTLYVINHEKHPVICDAKYSSGPDKQNKREEMLDPEKGVQFKFVYGRHSTEVLVTFACVKPELQPSQTQPPQEIH